MLRVTTLYAVSAVATAAYYTRYLADGPVEVPGRWSGDQAVELGVSGPVEADELQRLLEGRHPLNGESLGAPLKDRQTAAGRVVKAVAGFDATFSAPKSVSVWWALTGDPGVLDAHDLAVRAALDHLQRYGATTRIRHAGRRLHPDTRGLTVASFRQTTSRADDPQLHTHAVISAKVRTEDGRWLALDARFLKRHQRMLGGLYQSVLRAEISHRYGITWKPVVNGQAEIAGVPADLLARFSKRTVQVEDALAGKVAEFLVREGRDPSRWERAAMEREAAADTRTVRAGHAADDLQHRWRAEALEVGWKPERFTAALTGPAHEQSPTPPFTAEEILDQLSTTGSTWTRADVTRAVCDLAKAPAAMSGRAWAAEIERRVDDVLARCVDLDPVSDSRRRGSHGRSVWLEPTSPHHTSPAVLAEEERILAWAAAAQDPDPQPSTSVDRAGLDVLQGDAAAAVSGADRLVVVVGPAGTGKTSMLRAAVDDLQQQRRPVFGVAPTAKAAHVLAAGTGMDTDTVAKLLHEWQRPDRPVDTRYQLPAGTTLVVDEAGMVGTASLHQLISLADTSRWRLVLIGDPRQLQAVGRGGLFTELCRTSRVVELTRVHRFTHRWEADASLQLRAGDPDALDHYARHNRIRAGTLDTHLEAITAAWLTHTVAGRTVAVTASSNDHVDTLNHHIQQARLAVGQLDPATAIPVGAGEPAHVGEIVGTRRNQRDLVTSTGETVRNREQWTITGIHPHGGLTLTRGRATVSVPVDYVREHVRLGYAATEHGHQGDTVDIAIALTSSATTHRGLYVAATRGRDENRIHVITDTADLTEARDTLEAILTHDRADIPAVTQRRQLAARTVRRGLSRGWLGSTRGAMALPPNAAISSSTPRPSPPDATPPSASSTPYNPSSLPLGPRGARTSELFGAWRTRLGEPRRDRPAGDSSDGTPRGSNRSTSMKQRWRRNAGSPPSSGKARQRGTPSSSSKHEQPASVPPPHQTAPSRPAAPVESAPSTSSSMRPTATSNGATGVPSLPNASHTPSRSSPGSERISPAAPGAKGSIRRVCTSCSTSRSTNCQRVLRRNRRSPSPDDP